MPLNPSQQMLLQALMSHGILNASDLFKILEQCCVEYDIPLEDQRQRLVSYVRDINEAVGAFGLRIKEAVDEVEATTYYCLVNSLKTNFTLLSSIYTQNELEFYKKLVESIITSDNGNIGSMAAVNISDSLSKKMSKSDAEDLIERFIQSKWLGKTKKGHVYLGCRSIVELEQYLRTMYEENVSGCNLCKSLCTQGSSCDKCDIKIHYHCARKYFKSMSNKTCPRCKAVWNGDIRTSTANIVERQSPTASSKIQTKPLNESSVIIISDESSQPPSSPKASTSQEWTSRLSPMSSEHWDLSDVSSASSPLATREEIDNTDRSSERSLKDTTSSSNKGKSSAKGGKKKGRSKSQLRKSTTSTVIGLTLDEDNKTRSPKSSAKVGFSKNSDKSTKGQEDVDPHPVSDGELDNECFMEFGEDDFDGEFEVTDEIGETDDIMEIDVVPQSQRIKISRTDDRRRELVRDDIKSEVDDTENIDEEFEELDAHESDEVGEIDEEMMDMDNFIIVDEIDSDETEEIPLVEDIELSEADKTNETSSSSRRLEENTDTLRTESNLASSRSSSRQRSPRHEHRSGQSVHHSTGPSAHGSSRSTYRSSRQPDTCQFAGGHLGRDKTYDKIRQHYCSRINIAPSHSSSPLNPIQVPAKVWSLIGIDIIGPFERSKFGNKYIVAATDHFSKWSVAEAIPYKNAECVSKFLLRMICTYGPMDSIISDQGKEYTDSIIDKVTQSLDIEHRISSAYHPQTNGQRERDNRTLKEMLSKHVDNNSTNWDEDLDLVMFAYRTSVHSSTKVSPFQVMFGRDPKLVHGTEKLDRNYMKCLPSKVTEVIMKSKQKSSNEAKKLIPPSESLNQKLCKKLNIKCVEYPKYKQIGDKPIDIKRIIGDGNCFFRAISYAISGTQDHHKEIRTKTIAHMMSDETSNQLKPFLNNKSVKKYITESNMKNDGTWATDIEIMSVASLLETDICVYTRHGYEYSWPRYPASFSLEKLTEESILLENIGNDHFNVVLG